MNTPRDLIVICIRPTEAALPCIIEKEATMAAKPADLPPAASSDPVAPAAPVSIRTAVAQRIAAGPRPRATKVSTNSMLDYILVAGAMLMVGGGIYGLFTVRDIPKETLPIIASLLSFLCGSILGAYAGYRWGASDAMKRAAGAGS